MAARKIRLVIQDMSWEKCVSRVEQGLKPISGVEDLSVRLVQDRVGEVEISCVPEELDLDKLKTAVSAASGPHHKFVVLSVIEEHD